LGGRLGVRRGRDGVRRSCLAGGYPDGEPSGGAQSNAVRKILRDETYALIRTHGITGAGFRYISPPHNLVLGTMAAAGILGLAGLTVIVATTVIRYLSLTSREHLSLGVLAGTVAVWSAFWFVNPGWDRWLWVPLAVVMAERFVGNRADEPQKVPTTPYVLAQAAPTT
jgi:hypothetical protein